jgi:hypothetical protein
MGRTPMVCAPLSASEAWADMRWPLIATALFAGCSGDPLDGTTRPRPDLAIVWPSYDLSWPDPPDLGPRRCSELDLTCFRLGPGEGVPFPLPSDLPPVDPNVESDGVARDNNGYLGIASSHATFDWGVIPNATDWSRGTLSKVDARTTREVARYFTVTCSSLKTGGTGACDGLNGCCARDSFPQFTNRRNNQAQGPYQQVQRTDNRPSRTSLDWTGDMWVENRAPGGEASVTKIANDLSDCIDRNQNGKIDTSLDASGDGLIQTDCNNDGQPDDLASVKMKPCANNAAQEFFGLDDECVLFTTNVGVPAQDGRALSLGPGAKDFGPSDAWAGTFSDATFYRVDGITGITKDIATLPNVCQPDGLTLDGHGIAWTTTQSFGSICWFITQKPSDQGKVRDPQSGPVNGRAISLDRDQDLWLADRTGAGAWRYTPDRSAGTTHLGDGFWTRVTSAGKAAGATGNGVGIALDSRTANSYFAWLALDAGWLVRLPASKIAFAKQDQIIDATNEPALPLQGIAPIAIGVTADANLHVVSRAPSALVQVLVDVNGTMMPGASRLLKDNQISEPGSDAYTDFDMWNPRIDRIPRGYYRYIVQGCKSPDGTKWISITWDADVPLDTQLAVKARAGRTQTPDPSWGQWTPDFSASPADLVNGMPLVPNGSPDANYLQFEFDLSTLDKNRSPKLKSVEVAWECPAGGG